MNPELEDLYQQVLLDHSKRPRNFGRIDDAVHVHGDNPSCGDEIDLSVRFGPEHEVAEIKFTGQGCAICMASASMMTMKLKGRSEAAATELLNGFHRLVTGGDGPPARGLGDLQLMEGVRKFPQRVKCAMLAWRAFEQALAAPGAEGAAVSTESNE
jgi:nitrogen fixation protein NifU and related proteins